MPTLADRTRRALAAVSRPSRASRLAVWLPLLILLAGATGSAGLALLWERTIDAHEHTDFDNAVAESTAAVGSELQRTEDALRGTRGVFASTRHVTAAGYRAYVQSLDVAERYPSIRALAYVTVVPTRSLAEFAAAQRRDGRRDFVLRTAPGADPSLEDAMQRRIVTFAEPDTPLAGRPGYDITGRRPSRVAQDYARDTGRAALTPKQELVPGGELGVSMALPIYRGSRPPRTVAGRRAAIRGFVVARVSAQRFVAGVRTPGARRLAIEVFDGPRAELAALLARVPAAPRGGGRTRTVPVRRGGRDWTVRYTALGAGARGALLDPLAVLLVGLTLSALLAALVRTQMAARHRADREVYQRTAQLRRVTAELYHANADLEAHTREVEAFARRQRDFVATASHELRTPLTSILGYLELVLGAPPEELRDEQRGHLQIVYRSGKRLLAIVSDLLTVDKTDAGAMEIRPQPTTLEALLGPTVDAFAPQCAAKNIALTVETPDAPVPVHADPERMHQVLGNIVGNAVKLTPASGRIRLTARVAGDRAELRISDTGPGIAADELPHLFDRFYRTEASMRAATPGTGLGLTIARSLVEAHDGTLTVESELGAGTTFVVSLPAASAVVGSAA